MKHLMLTVLMLCATVLTSAQTYELTAVQNGDTLGVITFKLLPEVAPMHAAFMAARISEGWYDETAFHRVIPGFMIQGGDPHSKSLPKDTWGFGGYSEAVPAEFTNTPHKRGIISAARTNDPNSFRGQFFICVADSRFLDGQYSVFGEVMSGMDVADKIVNMPRDARDNPFDKVSMYIKATTTSVQEVTAGPALTIHPQPVRSTMVVNVDAPVELTIMDLTGAVVLTNSLEGGVSALEVGDLPCGAYVVAVTGSEGTRFMPVVIATE